MGATNSKQQKKRKRRPSIHSGQLYIHKEFSFNSTRSSKTKRSSTLSPLSPLSKTKSSSLFPPSSSIDDDDFDKSASELKENLPENLKIYSNSIETIYRFWINEIEALNENDFKEAAVLFYFNVFQLIPDARSLFTKNIELQSLQFFGMFRWLVNNLAQPNAERLIKRIRLLGNAHKQMNIKNEWYQSFLMAFHETMIETTGTRYTPRIRFSMEQLYTVVMNIMTEQDFHSSLSSKKISSLLKSIKKLEDCLEDIEAQKYLKMYMSGQFCVELILFYQEYCTFRAAMTQFQRQAIGDVILKKFLLSSSECEINISYGTKNGVFQILEENKNVFTPNIFDGCIKEVIELIRMNIWVQFRKSIECMSVDADINFH